MIIIVIIIIIIIIVQCNKASRRAGARVVVVRCVCAIAIARKIKHQLHGWLANSHERAKVRARVRAFS